MYAWRNFWKISGLFLGEIFERILQRNIGVSKKVFKNISQLFPGNMSLEKILKKFLKKLLEKFNEQFP